MLISKGRIEELEKHLHDVVDRNTHIHCVFDPGRWTQDQYQELIRFKQEIEWTNQLLVKTIVSEMLNHLYTQEDLENDLGMT